MKNVWVRRILSVVILIALLLGVQRLVQPKYVTDLQEGSYTSEYYKETLGHQVLMVGDCELYENFDPVTLWENYGITSYIRGNAQQLVWQSYYLLKEALETETPDVVVFNVLELKYDEPQKEEYNRLTLDTMKWSANKVAAIRASMTEDESFWDYLFPILRYHSRITQLTEEDITCFASSARNTVSGYYMRMDTNPYVIGEWGEENDVGAYTADYLMQTAAEEGTDETEDDADDEWTADGDEDDADDEWTADGDEDDADDEWTADGDEDDADDEWTADGDEDDTDDEWTADGDEDDADDEWTTDGDEDDADDEWTADGDEDDADDEWTTDGDEDDADDEWTADGDEDDADDEWTADGDEDDTDDEWEPANGREDVEPLGDNAMHYLDLIRELCSENGITLLLVKAPSVSPVWYDKWDEQIQSYAKTYQLDYLNYLPLVDEIGIDFAADTYDGGLHMNYYGAVKCADYLGQYLVSHYDLNDNRSDADIAAVWNIKKEQQQSLMEAQEN